MLIIKPFRIVLISLFAFALVSVTGGADSFTQESIKDKINALKQENLRLDALISEVESSITEKNRLANLYAQKLRVSEEQVDYYSNLIYENEQALIKKEAEISEVEKEIKTRADELEQARAAISSLNEQNEQNLEIFGRIIAELYMSGSVEIAPFIQGSSDIYDIMIAREVMENVSRQNLEFMNSLLESIEKQEQMAAEIDTRIAVLGSEREKLAGQKESLAEKRAELMGILEAGKAQSAEFKSIYSKYKNAVSGLEMQKSTYNQSKSINKAEADAFDKMLREKIADSQTNGEYIEGEWLWPLEPEFINITTEFGYDPWRGGSHNGIDISGSGINWTNIYAAKSGIVTVAENSYTPGYSYGKFIVIDHGGGYISLYGHCNDIYISTGQEVKAGEVIGAVGSTGWSTGPHLHFEIRINGTPHEPRDYIGR